jgi:formylglycine-generating enzyme required for sulfatase activity
LNNDASAGDALSDGQAQEHDSEAANDDGKVNDSETDSDAVGIDTGLDGTDSGHALCPDQSLWPSGWVCVSAGSFMMGSPTSEIGHQTDETPHQVNLTKPFWIMATEVTQMDWEKRMGSNPSFFYACGADCPVDAVNWFQAVAYANILSVADGLERCYQKPGGGDYDSDAAANTQTPSWSKALACAGYRLPTEAEWEYAARAGSTTAFYKGNVNSDTTTDCHVEQYLSGWYCESSIVTYTPCYNLYWSHGQGWSTCAGTHPVGQLEPNAWGIFDMEGTVWEWVWDWYGNYDGAITDPMGPGTGQYRGKRGGAWDVNPIACRSAARGETFPQIQSSFGLRIVRSAQ